MRKSLINDVLSKDDVSTSNGRGAPVGRGLEGATASRPSGAISEEAVEIQTLREEIVKMVNHRNVQHMKSQGRL